jgi:hypothetical protein
MWMEMGENEGHAQRAKAKEAQPHSSHPTLSASLRLLNLSRDERKWEFNFFLMFLGSMSCEFPPKIMVTLSDNQNLKYCGTLHNDKLMEIDTQNIFGFWFIYFLLCFFYF